MISDNRTKPKSWLVRFRAHYYFLRAVERSGRWRSLVTAFRRSRMRNYGRAAAMPSEALIWVNSDGTARELTDAEKRYVDADFSPFDGARPYIKSHYSQRTKLGDIKGFLHRKEVPDGIPINPASELNARSQ